MRTLQRPATATPASPEHSESHGPSDALTPQEKAEVAAAAKAHPATAQAAASGTARLGFVLTHDEVVLIEGFEGWERVIPGSKPPAVEQYLDGAGVPTIGFGTTDSDVSPLPHRMTFPQSESLLIRKLHSPYGTAVAALNLPNPNMQAACLSIAYNCGPGILGSGFTLGRALIARDWAAAAAAFMLYVHDIRGVVEPGLVTRRRIEQARFRKPWTPPDPHHYHWFTSRERPVVEEYDRLRKLQTGQRHPHRVRLAFLRARLRFYSLRVAAIAHRQREKDGKPSWGRFHRGWRRIELADRAKGERKV